MAIIAAATAVTAGLSGCIDQAAPNPTVEPLHSTSFPSVGYGFSIADVVEGLDQPTGVAVSADGSRLFVSGGNGAASGIARLDDKTDAVAWLGAELGDPGLIATSPGGGVYAVDQHDDDLHVSADQGETWTSIPAATGGFAGSQAVAARDGLVVVTNGDDDSVSISVDTGATWRRVDASTGSFAGVAGVAIDDDGRILVVDSQDGGISTSADQGTTWQKIDGAQTGFTSPLAIAVGPHGEIVVTDPGAGGLARSVDGGQTWTSTSGFENAFGVAIDGEGLVYVTDDQFSLVKLAAVPGPPQDVTARWGEEPGSVTVSWRPNAVTGGAAVTEQMVSVLLDPSADQEKSLGFVRERDRDLKDSAEPEATPSAPVVQWDSTVEPDVDETSVTGITPGMDVLVTVTVTNSVGASVPTSVRLTSTPGGGDR